MRFNKTMTIGTSIFSIILLILIFIPGVSENTMKFFSSIFRNGEKIEVNQDPYKLKREQMVEEQIKARGVSNTLVLDAMRKVKRHKFVSERYLKYAYDDGPLPIDMGQTISQPYIVAFMTEAIEPKKDYKVLEIGTGSGYQAAVLAEIVSEVYSIEYFNELAQKSSNLLKSLDYKNVFIKAGDGFFGWEEFAPFDAIIVTAAPSEIPQPLIDQLKEGGKMIIPVGNEHQVQSLVLLKKENGKIIKTDVMQVKFVPFLR